MTLLLTFIAAAYATLAVWAATSPRIWFVRAGVYCAALALLLPIQAYEPLVLFGLTVMWMVAGAQLAPRDSRSKSSAIGATGPPNLPASAFRYSLQDLFLVAAIVAFASLGVGLMLREHVFLSWWRAATAAGLLALISSLAAGLVIRRWRVWCLAGLLIAVPFAAAIEVYVLGDWMHVDELLSIYRHPSIRGAGLIHFMRLYVFTASWSILFAILMPAWQPADRPGVLRRLLRVAALAVAVPLTLLLICVYWNMLGRLPNQAQAKQGENVYPQVLALADGIELASPTEASATYAELLPLLGRKGHVVLDWENAASQPGSQRLMHDNLILYNLVHSLSSQSELHHARGQFEDASKYAEATLHLSRIASTGGIVGVDPPGQVAFNRGVASVTQIRRGIAPQQARELARLLESLEHDREPAEATIQRDTLWRANSRRWRFALERSVFGDLFGFDTEHTPHSRANEETVRELRCLGCLVSIDLALRAYRADHGAWPPRLEALCPDYLGWIPSDPLSGQPFVYRPEEPEFVLYSVGKDGQDDGGRFGNAMRLFGQRRSFEGYDIDADTFVRP